MVNDAFAVYVYSGRDGAGLRYGESDERITFSQHGNGGIAGVLHECSGGKRDGVSHEFDWRDVASAAVKKPP